MNRRGFLLSTASLGLSSFAFNAFAQGAKVFKWVPQTDVTVYDPHFTTANITSTFGHIIYDSLFGLDDAGVPQPQMVGEHSASEDGLTWTFKLRDGLVFNDGSPVTSTDAAASITRWSKNDDLGKLLTGATAAVECPDAQTLVIKLNAPFPLMLRALAKPASSMLAILPAKSIEAAGDKQVNDAVGSGPFLLDRGASVSGSHLVFNKNPAYVARADGPEGLASSPKSVDYDRLEWRIIPDQSTAIAALMAGEVDGIERIQTDFVELLVGRDDIKLFAQTQPVISVARFNHLYPPFNNKAIRQAILSVVDQEQYMLAINGEAMREYWDGKCGIFVPSSPFASDAGFDKVNARTSIDAARQAIIDAGYKGEKVVLLDTVDHASHHVSAVITADLLSKLGMNVEVVSLDWNTGLQRRNSKADPSDGGWNIAFTGLTGASTSDPISYMAMRGIGEGGWFGWPTAPALEETRDLFIGAQDIEAQKAAARTYQEQAYDEVPFIVLGATYNVGAVSAKWLGRFNGVVPIFYNIKAS